MINRFIKQYLLNNNFYLSSLSKFFLKWLKKLEVKEIYWLDQLEDYSVEQLCQTTNALSCAPRISINHNYSITTHIPATYLYLFNKVILHTHSSNFLYGTQQELMIERVSCANLKFCDYTTGFLRFHNSTHALIRKNPFKVYRKFKENCLYLGGNGVYNYYHWLIEIAPKLLLVTPQLLEKYNIHFLIIDKSIQTIPSLNDILKLLLKKQELELEIIYQNNHDLRAFENSFYINNRNNFVFNSKEKLSSIYFSQYCPILIKQMRHFCLEQSQLKLQQPIYPDKIFLARKSGTARSYNQNEILEYFQQIGFTALYLDEYSFLEQVSIFNQAKFIIGPTGAAWSNIIFCQPGTQALCWLSEQLAEFSVFSTLATLVQCDMRFVLAQAENQDDPHSNYSVQLDTIIELYEKMLT